MLDSQPTKTYRGTWEEIASHRHEIPAGAVLEVKVYEPPEAESRQGPRNEKMLAILRGIEERHKDRPDTDGDNTQRLIDEARGGAMYGYEPAD